MIETLKKKTKQNTNRIFCHNYKRIDGKISSENTLLVISIMLIIPSVIQSPMELSL